MKTVWILGAGQFGEIAGVRLRLKYPEAEIIIVDQDSAALREVEAVASTTVLGEGTAYLAQHLEASGPPDWIVPAIPVHVAFEWIGLQLAATHRLEKLKIPGSVTQNLGKRFTGQDGRVYTSLADFTCPGNCPEPAELCFVTGKPRPVDLHKELTSVAPPLMTPVIVRSRQLSAGVGGYRPGDLFEALRQIEACAGPVLLGTACRCHSVLDAFRLIPRNP